MKKVMIVCLSALAIWTALAVLEDIHLHKNYVYRVAEYDCGCGVLGARLIGTRVTRGRHEVWGSPYTILVWFHSQDGGATVTLRRAELHEADKRGRVCAEMEESTDRLHPDWRGGYAAYFRLEGLNLEYIPYIMTIELVVEKGKKTESRKVELFFEQDYRESWSLGFMEV